MSQERTHNIYVIELKPEVKKTKRFMELNPDYIEGKKCFYVGYTSKTPEKRFEDHKNGHKHSSRVKKYGIALRPWHYAHHNPMTKEDAIAMEEEKARRLRKKGYGVWQF